MKIFLLIIASIVCMNIGMITEKQDSTVSPVVQICGVLINMVLAITCYYFVLRG